MKVRLAPDPKVLDRLPVAPVGLPAVTAARMAEMDEVLLQEAGLPLLVMMENAGRALATLTRLLYPEAATVVVLAGKGGNGGGGLAAARHLLNAGLDVRVHLATRPERLSEAGTVQARVLGESGVPLRVGRPGTEVGDVVLDALLGYAQRGRPRDEAAGLVSWSLETGAPVLALDVPTGLDPDTGAAHEPCSRPVLTLTLALPKRGLLTAPGRSRAGTLLLADIGVPPQVHRAFGAPEALFSAGPVLRLSERPSESSRD